jgi:hypothetical protein
MRTRAAILLALFAAAALLALGRTQLLTEYPTETMPASTVSRSTHLISGTYMWTV